MKNCKNCKESFYPNRSDQLYCSNQCRYSFNNGKNKPPTDLMKKEQESILKNRNILKLISSNKNSTSLDILESLGYDIEALSSLQDMGDGEFIYWCYDYGYWIDHENESENNVTLTDVYQN